MRLFGFFHRKKTIAPSSRSSVHPANNGQDFFGVQRAKIKEYFGVATPKECREVDELLDKMSLQVEPSCSMDADAYDEEAEEDEELADADSIEKVEENSNDRIAVVQDKGRSKSDLQVSTANVELAVNKVGQSPIKAHLAKPVEEFAIRKPCSMDMTTKCHGLHAFPWKPGSADMTVRANASEVAAKTPLSHQSSGATNSTAKMNPAQRSARKYRRVRPPKLTSVDDEAAALSSRNGLGIMSESSNVYHIDKIRREQNVSCHGSFPLPLPFDREKHYLPTPQTGTSEEVICVAHPLPQPQPSTPTRTSRAVMYDPLGKAHLSSNKEGISVPHAKSSDPPKQLLPKQETLQSNVGGGIAVPIQGLKSTPPTSPCLQSHQNPHTPPGTPPLTPRNKQHQTFQDLQSTAPTTPGPQTHRPPCGILSTLLGTEPRQTPQSTPLTTPGAHHSLSLHVLQSTPPTSPLQSHQPLLKSLSATTGTEHHPTPPITPPTTPRKQNHPTDQASQSTPPASPRPLYHQTLRNTVSTATSRKLHQTPENIPQTTPRQEYHRTLQSTPPTRQLNPQVSAKVTGKLQSPPSSSRKPPKLTASYRQSPPPFPSSHAQSAPCSPLSKSLCPRNWKKSVMLGRGTFGAVHEGWNMEDGSFFAVKVSSREDTLPEIQQEVDVLSKLEHPNIVRYLGSSVVENRLCIFLELVRMGSLESLLRKYKRFEEDTIRSYTRQILLGLEYLHGKRTIHRDIKSGNILVDVNGQVKLSDFGIAKQIDESLASSLKGTPLYMAPEVLMPVANSKSSYSFPADIWSLGCTVFELADGKPPWSNLQGFGFFFKVKEKELPPMPEHLSPDGQDFIRRCLQFHPEDRPTASELLQHRFVLNVPTPEPLSPLSPSSPLSPKLWQAASPLNSTTWECGNNCPSSPIQETHFDRVLGGSQRVQGLIRGR